MDVLRGGTTAHLLQIKLPPWSAAFLVVVVVVVVVVVIVVVVEASVPRAPFQDRWYDGLPNMFCVGASSLGHIRSQFSILGGSFL